MKKLKKPTAAMLLAVIIISNAQGLVAYANEADTNVNSRQISQKQYKNTYDSIVQTDTNKTYNADTIKPELTSIEINKKDVIVGEEVEITVEAKDEGGSGISRIAVHYSSPITNKIKHVKLTKESDGKYRGKLLFTDKDESGEWIIHRVEMYDNAENCGDIYNSNNPDVLESWDQKDLGHCNITLTGTSVDTIKPELISIEVDKKDVKAGEEVEITLEAKDEGGSGISRIAVHYSSPVTNKKKSVTLTKGPDGKHRGKLLFTDKDESGEWMIHRVEMYDNAENCGDIYNSNNPDVLESWDQKDLGHCNITLTGTSVDTIKPELISIEVDKKDVKVGEEVEITLEAKDEGGSGIKSVDVHYSSPITYKKKIISLTKGTDGKYRGKLPLTDKDELGEWMIFYAVIYDNANNYRDVYNSKNPEVLHSWNQEDLSHCNFKLSKLSFDSIQPIEGATVVDTNQTLSNKTIDGDLYIGQEAALTIGENVTVNGNIYVLGSLKINGGLKLNGTLNGTKIVNDESQTVNNGTIIIKGSNSIGDTNISNYPVKDIPVRIDNTPLKATDGIIEIKGATLNIADMYLEGKKVTLDDKGRFDIKGINIGTKNKVKIELVPVFGNTIIKTYNVDNDQIPVIPMNRVPEISVSDVEIKLGEKFDPLSIVSARDYEDGDISDRVKVIENTVDINKAGVYKVVYKATDNQGASATKEIKVTVAQGLVGMNRVPEISASDVKIKVGEKFDPLSIVSARDYEDGDISDRVKVIENTVDINKAGVYKVVYKATDKQGASTTKKIKVTVVQGLVGMNRVPEISASDVEIKVGEKFDSLSIVSAKDYEDGDISDRVKVIENTVDTSKAGAYKVVYKVTDSKGASTTKEIKVTVVQGLVGMNKVPEISASDVEIKVGEKFNPLNGVTAKDYEDGDISDKIEVIENTVDTSKVGIYKVVYKIVDSEGATTSKTINVIVKEKIEFSDTKGHWAEKTINSFVDKGFINGYDDKTFKPDNSMTRAEFVRVVNNVFGYDQKGSEQFNDVNENDWFYSDICIGINMGYINGKSKDTFAPNDNITRQEVAMILTNIMNNKDNNLDKLNLFKDGQETDEWAKSSIEGAIEAGYLSGYGDETIRAKGNITRAEAISMLSRVK